MRGQRIRFGLMTMDKDIHTTEESLLSLMESEESKYFHCTLFHCFLDVLLDVFNACCVY